MKNQFTHKIAEKKFYKHFIFSVVLIFVVSNLTACTPPIKQITHNNIDRVLKKKIVMTGFAVPFPAQVADVDDIAQGIPREMLNRLEQSGKFLIKQSPNLLSYDLMQKVPEPKLVKQVAAEYDAQYVIAGEVKNAGVRTEKKYFGLTETKSRHIEISFSIYDGVSGVFLTKHHLYRPSKDGSLIGKDKPFGSVAFYATEYGKAIDAVLEEAVMWIRRDLATYPMVAKIIKVAGNEITIDVGTMSNLVVGDTGMVVAHYDVLPNEGLTSNQTQPVRYGVAQASMGKMTVIQTQFPFSIATLSPETKSDHLAIKVGDYVRFDGMIVAR